MGSIFEYYGRMRATGIGLGVIIAGVILIFLVAQNRNQLTLADQILFVVVGVVLFIIGGLVIWITSRRSPSHINAEPAQP